MSLPVVRLTGSAYAQGAAVGHALRDRVGHNVEVYFDRFVTEGRVTKSAVLERVAEYAEAIKVQSPEYHAGMVGIADGSGYSPAEIAALNVRYEILYYLFGINAIAEAAAPEPDGCTAFAILPEASANGHLIMGQNWDWIPQVQGAVLHTVHDDGMETLAFTEAGIFGGKIGLNNAGLGLAINGMTTTDDDWSRLRKPFHVRCYEILRSQTLAEAQAVITGEDRACSTNFLLAQAPDKAVDIEAAPDRVQVLECSDGCLVHTNHFSDPGGLGITEPPSERRPYSRYRRENMARLLASRPPIAIADIQEYVKDHEHYPFGICRHEDLTEPPSEHYITVTSVVMDLDEKVMHLTDGPPCTHPFETVIL